MGTPCYLLYSLYRYKPNSFAQQIYYCLLATKLYGRLTQPARRYWYLQMLEGCFEGCRTSLFCIAVLELRKKCGHTGSNLYILAYQCSTEHCYL